MKPPDLNDTQVGPRWPSLGFDLRKDTRHPIQAKHAPAGAGRATEGVAHGTYTTRAGRTMPATRVALVDTNKYTRAALEQGISTGGKREAARRLRQQARLG